MSDIIHQSQAMRHQKVFCYLYRFDMSLSKAARIAVKNLLMDALCRGYLPAGIVQIQVVGVL